MSDEQRVGDWMQVYSGGQFWPLDPRPEDIHIQDIAHALSMICRYNGHTSRFYSVAEHSVLVGRAAVSHTNQDRFGLRGLLHDAAEAYLCDVVRPVKRSIVGYAEAEAALETVIFDRFCVTPSGVELIKSLDSLILYDEAKALMGVHCIAWHERYAPGLGVEIVGMAPADAEAAFLAAFERYSG